MKATFDEQDNPITGAPEVFSDAAWFMHRDYTRYRRYCSARLRRLYRSLKFKHGRGKFVNNEITVSTITEVRYLHILLYMAERAWSHAMEKGICLMDQMHDKSIYLLGRLRKAVKRATLFAQFSAIKGDSRTSLEAEAYASYMKGTLLFEQDQNWRAALMNFRKARDVYEELGKYGSIENQILCRERVEELQPSIKYCLHKVGDSNMQTSELLDIGDVEGPALDLFKVKLEAVMAEARSQQAASMTEFYWLGHKYPINNAKTRVSILKALELEKNLNGPAADSLPAEKQLPIYDRIFSAYQEARACIRSDLAAAGSADNVKVELNGLDKAQKSKITKQRDDKSEKITKPEELVRLFDLLIQNATDLYDLVSSQRNINPEEETLPRNLNLRVWLSEQKDAFIWQSPTVLLLTYVEFKIDIYISTYEFIMQPLIKDLRTLSDNCRSSSCIEHATGIMEEERIPEKLSKSVSNITLTEPEKKVEKFLLDKLDLYESAVGEPGTKSSPCIDSFPPPFQAVPCNPIVLDIAYSSIEFPSLESRMKKDKKSIFSSDNSFAQSKHKIGFLGWIVMVEFQVEIVDDEMKSGIMNALRVLKQTWLRSISIAGCSLIKGTA
ncbi:hypothetical protein HPP92_028724 [Vanilla planifolia]|uniref:Signal recognition particle subunit SRP68 n=1 Tax=Vanilla planifolia TaxID=51239 RepID=A0A835P6B7_VANPL|nr:hypothetical protein HPP92_028724 [Vanilla planifolia]